MKDNLNLGRLVNADSPVKWLAQLTVHSRLGNRLSKPVLSYISYDARKYSLEGIVNVIRVRRSTYISHKKLYQ